MAGRLNYAKTKHLTRLKTRARTLPDDGSGTTSTRLTVNLRGWRLTDGKTYPVTITRITDKEPSHD